jgi:hypothetical protein
MRRALCACVLFVAASAAAFAIDVSTASGATLDITTRTSFGVNLDNPGQYGLKVEFPEFGVYYNLAPNQEITTRVKSDRPAGFIDLHMDVQNIRFSNGSNPDDNASKGSEVGLDFNDSSSSTTGYFGPFYIYGFESGIAYNGYVLQLAAGGDDAFWKPWNRTLEFLNDKLANSWAYMDTRVQYGRDKVAALPLDTNDVDVNNPAYNENNYWNFQTANTAQDSLTSTISGTMVGLQHATDGFSYMVKLATEYGYDDASKITSSDKNGIAAGFDYATTPFAIKGFRVLGSVTGSYDYGPDANSDPVFAGAKASFDFPVPGQKGVSVEPYIGYDGKVSIASDYSTKYGQEFAGGATIHWPGKSGWLFDYLKNRSGVVYPGLTAAYKLYLPDNGSAAQHSLLVTLMEETGDAGALYGVGAEAVLQFFDFTSKSDGMLMASLYADYTIKQVLGGKLVPWGKAFYDYYPDPHTSALKLELGAKLKDSIQNAVLGLSWDSGTLIGTTDAAGDRWGEVKTYVEIGI